MSCVLGACFESSAAIAFSSSAADGSADLRPPPINEAVLSEAVASALRFLPSASARLWRSRSSCMRRAQPRAS